MTGIRRTLWVACFAAVGAAAVALAQQPPPEAPDSPAAVPSAGSANYTLDWVVFDVNAADQAESTGYRIETTLGQSVAGVTAGPSGRAELGFWYGLSHWLFSDGFESGGTTLWDSAVGD